jgi:three-Cys-motif partner protein
MRQLPQPEDDGLYIPEVAEHSRHKHHFIEHYINAFTTAMKDKRWESLHYVDLFAGAGIERLRKSRTLAWGSPMIAVQARHPFARLHLCEQNARCYNALHQRVTALRPDSQILKGDANKKINTIVGEIPDRALSLCFIDPYGLHMDLDTLRSLSAKRVDLILFFPDRLDALRNWAAYYLKNPESNLDRCLGHSVDWRARLQGMPAHDYAKGLRDMYIEVIQQELGYAETGFERIKTVSGRPIYYLIFCSRARIALQIWRGVTRKKPNGQRTWDF